MKNTFLLLFFLASFSSFSQQNKTTKKEVVPPIEVIQSFEKQFPKIKPVWSSDYEGDAADDQRYMAYFELGKTTISMHYNILGQVKIVEESIMIDHLPNTILAYLKNNFPTFKINDAVKIRNDKNVNTFEVGMLLNFMLHNLMPRDIFYKWLRKNNFTFFKLILLTKLQLR